MEMIIICLLCIENLLLLVRLIIDCVRALTKRERLFIFYICKRSGEVFMDNLPFERSFNFVNLTELPPKPRKLGLTEIRGPYYEAFTLEQLKSLLETWGYYIDGFKF